MIGICATDEVIAVCLREWLAAIGSFAAVLIAAVAGRLRKPASGRLCSGHDPDCCPLPRYH